MTIGAKRVLILLLRLGNLSKELEKKARDASDIARELQLWATPWRGKGPPDSAPQLIDRLIDRAKKQGVDISLVESTLRELRAELSDD